MSKELPPVGGLVESVRNLREYYAERAALTEPGSALAATYALVASRLGVALEATEGARVAAEAMKVKGPRHVAPLHVVTSHGDCRTVSLVDDSGEHVVGITVGFDDGALVDARAKLEWLADRVNSAESWTVRDYRHPEDRPDRGTISAVSGKAE